jgi:hypothetical protein
MSKQAAVDFLAKVDSDPKVHEDALKSIDQVVGVGAKNGYDFSKEELREALADKWKVSSTLHPHTAQYCTFSEPL